LAVRRAIAANAKAVADFKKGKVKAADAIENSPQIEKDNAASR
jgi:hypothetical protein